MKARSRRVTRWGAMVLGLGLGLAACGERPWGWWQVRARVSRSIFADDYVYAISQLGIRVVRTDALAEPVATVGYSCDEECYGYGWW